MKLSQEELSRYSRHIKLEDIGSKGQLKLKAASVLVVGAGGLGCPALQYLAAAGVGTIGIADFDTVEESNLQRQILFSINDIGLNKAEQATLKLKLLNPLISYNTYNFKLTVENALEIINDYDIIIDGSDNFETRYLINDACVLLDKILVYGSVYKMQGQVSVFNLPMNNGTKSATYRCLFPSPSINNMELSCSFTGILGVVPGIVGTLQAAEAIKVITGIGDPLSNTLLTIDAKHMHFAKWNFSRNENEWNDYPSSAQAFKEMNYNLFCNGSTKVKKVGSKIMNAWIDSAKPLQIVDIRELHEMSDSPFRDAVHIPFSEFENRMTELDHSVQTVIFCSSGMRSELIVSKLAKIMNENLLFSLDGGINSYLEEIEN